MSLIGILYKCKCMESEGSFQIEERGDNEEIENFMERMGKALGHDHRRRSPLCVSDKTEYVKIYLPDDGRIGGRPR